MRRTMEWIRIPVFAAAFALMTGCSVNSNFVYKPSSPAAGERKLPVKVAVLPFEDGTENFTKRGSAFGAGAYNLARTGIAGSMTALPPEFWGKSFADELAASGAYRSARVVYSPSEIRADELLVEGTLRKVLFAASWDSPHVLLVSFKATRTSDKKVVWEKEIGKVWEQSKAIYAGCGTGLGCEVGKVHADWNRQMASLLGEARKDLAAALAILTESGAAGEGSGTKRPDPAGRESAEQTIDRILKGK